MYTTHIFTSTDSTNKIAFNLAQDGAEHGTAVIAEMQLKGRGRLDRSWHSPAKTGLYCSVIIRPKIRSEDYPKITLVAGLSVSQALDSSCGIQSSVKWPNDIYINGRKLGGILTESSPLSGGISCPFAVVGIGVNINNSKEDFAPEIAKKATSVFIETGGENDIEEVFQAIRAELLKDIEFFEQKGFSEILVRWRKKDMLQGKLVRWMSQNGEVICGKSEGPDLDGRLVVKDEAGVHHQIITGDVLLCL
ncbi:MAG: biotin--[acetyl-CoA-carboxylase] ligase [Desulfoprunum sp.]|nr:biotin--[acetyl-CoA-carboxylase] ligase [Desulfoprunum sp.]